MKTLKTIRLKPNPSGKDRTRRGGATATQLGGEWVDVQNHGQQPVDLTGVTLYHIAYDRSGRGTWQDVMRFKGILGAGQTLRVHAGCGPETVLMHEDRQGATYHLFTGRDQYVWNNDYGDCSTLWQEGQANPFDKACYVAYPPEGVVLVRSGDRLVAPAATQATYSRR